MKDYVHTAMLRSQEMFVPLMHPPGEAQADFGEALVVIAGVEQKAHYLAIRGRSKGSSATRGGTSWFRFHAPAVGTS